MSTPLIQLHLGLGSFHRAHQAVYLQRLHDLGDTGWVIAGGNLRPDMPETISALQAQGGAYTLETISPAAIASLREWLNRTQADVICVQELKADEAMLSGCVSVA